MPSAAMHGICHAFADLVATACMLQSLVFSLLLFGGVIWGALLTSCHWGKGGVVGKGVAGLGSQRTTWGVGLVGVCSSGELVAGYHSSAHSLLVI